MDTIDVSFMYKGIVIANKSYTPNEFVHGLYNKHRTIASNMSHVDFDDVYVNIKMTTFIPLIFGFVGCN